MAFMVLAMTMTRTMAMATMTTIYFCEYPLDSNYYSTESSLKYARRSNIFTTERADGFLLLFLLLLPLIVSVLDLMDTELLRDAARARVFKGQARVVLLCQSRGDEDVKIALV